jgi:hypothetical protein
VRIRVKIPIFQFLYGWNFTASAEILIFGGELTQIK